MSERLRGWGSWGRLRPVLLSAPLLGIVAAAASWDVGFGLPGLGLDPSWQAGIAMASRRGMDFGSEVNFPWGPLGFLRQAHLHYDGLSVLGVLYQSALHVGLCVTLVWTLSRRVHPLIAAAVVYLVVAWLGDIETTEVLAAAWCLAALDLPAPRLARGLVVVGGALLSAIEVMVKLSAGPVILAVFLITVLALDTRRRDAPAFLGLFAAFFAVLWFSVGQGVGNLDDFLVNSLQLISGYSPAMGVEGSGLAWQFFAAALVAAILIGGTAAGLHPRARRLAGTAIVTGVLFAAFKEGFVRHDLFHAAYFFSTAAALALAVPWRVEGWRPGQLVPAILASCAAALVIALAFIADPGPPTAGLNPVDRLRMLRSEVRGLLNAELRHTVTDAAAQQLRATYRVDRKSLALLRGHSVHVDPWEAAAAWAYDLDWQPLPVFQDYTAYTARLDELNADALAAADGPERVLRENTDVVDPSYPGETIDERSPALDPPAATVSMLCNFEALRTTRRWQVLARVPTRCSAPRPAGEVETSYGETVPVPRARAGELVIAAVEGAEVGGLERLQPLLYKSAERRISFGGERSYRLIPGTSGDGLLLDAGPGADFPAPFAFSPRARSLTITKGDTTDPLSIRFYRVTVVGAGPAHLRSS
ncbi:MAG: hypothetical protein AABM29_04685 [Actinomycetota bacterium]